jgi:hypothetical protein
MSDPSGRIFSIKIGRIIYTVMKGQKRVSTVALGTLRERILICTKGKSVKRRTEDRMDGFSVSTLIVW